MTRARAEAGANLWVAAFVPDPPRVRRLEDALGALPPEELHLRATLLGRLTVVGGADVDATDRVRAWADEAVAVARATGDPVLVAQALINQTMSPRADRRSTTPRRRRRGRPSRRARPVDPTSRSTGTSAAPATTSTAATSVPPTSPWARRGARRAAAVGRWRQSTLVQRTTLLALRGNRSAAAAAMYEAAASAPGTSNRSSSSGCEAMHQLMLFDLYGHADARAEEVYRIATEMFDDVPSPVLQVQKGFGAQLFGDETSVHEVLHRYGSRPERLCGR